MHKEHRQQHLKSNNLISKLAIIVLSVVLLTGISLVPALQVEVYGQVQQQQPQQQKQVGLSQVIKQIAQQVANANPGTNATHVQQILVQLAKQTAQTSSQVEAIKEIRQISSQVTAYPFGTLSQVLSYFSQQVASGNSNIVQIVQQTIQEKASSISKNITQSLSNVAVQQASGGSKNVNLVIRNAAQILANRAGVPVEKVEAVIIQIALQFAQAQEKAITGQYILQLANQIIQDPNGVLAQAILQIILQDNVGKSSQTTTIIKNVIKISREDDSGDERPRPPKKQLVLSISFAKDTITRGSTQTVIVTVTDASTKSPISGVSVSITVTYASGSTTKSFSGTTDTSGKVSFSFPIGGNSTPGIFKVSVHASKAGYQSASSKSSFKVIEAAQPGPICPQGIDSCPPCSIQGNQTGIDCVPPPPPSPPPCDPAENQTCLPPPDPCIENPTAEGCEPIDPCIENPTAEGCTPAPDPCEEDPTAEGCTPPPEQEEEVEEDEDVEEEEVEEEEAEADEEEEAEEEEDEEESEPEEDTTEDADEEE
jgi:hypothetical protein